MISIRSPFLSPSIVAYLRASILDCEGLTAMDKNGLSDPFVRLEYLPAPPKIRIEQSLKTSADGKLEKALSSVSLANSTSSVDSTSSGMLQAMSNSMEGAVQPTINAVSSAVEDAVQPALDAVNAFDEQFSATERTARAMTMMHKTGKQVSPHVEHSLLKCCRC
jgi:hypothetical protein